MHGLDDKRCIGDTTTTLLVATPIHGQWYVRTDLYNNTLVRPPIGAFETMLHRPGFAVEMIDKNVSDWEEEKSLSRMIKSHGPVRSVYE